MKYLYVKYGVQGGVVRRFEAERAGLRLRSIGEAETERQAEIEVRL
jgi:hypothetical protein